MKKIFGIIKSLVSQNRFDPTDVREKMLLKYQVAVHMPGIKL
jgi:hypothetical protein